ncbi:hypothetical protein N0V90_007706 [Kalmusia sp. IMI 367209]|nr:hypothetical protein N0V90_007706 [Kalmusia sp. IMI 367209]
MMATANPETFECTICGEHHTLSSGHSGHKSHCIFCLLYQLARTIIPVASSCRLNPAQVEKNNMIKVRKKVIGTVIPIIVLAFFAFRWEMQYWPRAIKGFGEGEGLWKDKSIWLMLCMVGCAPCGCVLGFIVSGIYYIVKSWRKRKAKRRKALRQSGVGSATSSPSVPLEEKPLADVRYDDLREMNETGMIEIVITPPEEAPEPAPQRDNRVSRMLGVVADRFRNGYDGRAIRREAMEEIDEVREQLHSGVARRNFRPITQWPGM